MITIPEVVAQALGSFLTSDTKNRFGSSDARLAEVLPFAARLTQEAHASMPTSHGGGARTCRRLN